MKKLILSAMSLLFLSACTNSFLLPKSTLKLALEANPKTLDPAFSTGTYSGILIGLCYSNLLSFDKEGNIVLDATKFYSVSDKGRKYSFLLKENIKFSNGDVLTSADVAYTLNRLANPKLNSPRAWLLKDVVGYNDYKNGRADSLKGIEIEGPQKLTIRLSKPFSPFLSMFAMPQMAILNKKFMQAGGDLSEATLGSGPFSLKSWRRDQDLLFIKNTYHKKKGNLNAIHYKILKDPFTRLAEYKKANLDIVEVSPSQQKQITDTSSKMSVNQYNLYFMGLSMKSKKLQDLKTRQAIAQAIDKEVILEKLLKGQGMIAHGPVPKGLQGHLEKSTYSFDAKKSQVLLKASSYEGQTLDLVLWNEPKNMMICQSIKQYLEKAGFKIKLKPLDWNAFTEALVKLDYDLFYRNWIADFPDGDNFLYPLFHSQSKGLKGNYPMYSSETFDQVITKSRKESNADLRRQMLEQAAKTAVVDASRVFLWFKKKTYVVNKRVKNFHPHPLYNSNKYLEVDLLEK
ncbi:MAG: ABC transporter substrate-binding protein [Candidatus Cloacimonetes bacterium]|nr:ABC transporter substrate-binding protein [Candidatus Cloacimonadota bacterium]